MFISNPDGITNGKQGHHRWRAVVPINRRILRLSMEIPQKGYYGGYLGKFGKKFPHCFPTCFPIYY